jgi:hypothetical protein
LQHLFSNSTTWLTLLFDPDMDGSNNLKFYWIDLIEAAKRSIQNPLYAEKLYHAFETATDAEGCRVFQKANSGLVFESFQLLDPTSSPILVIVASDAAHVGNNPRHPLYCKLIFQFKMAVI